MKYMKTDEIINRIFSIVEKSGNVSRIIPIVHLKELNEELKMQHKKGSFSDDFYKERLTSFKFHNPTSFKEAKSIIIIAVPQPTVVLVFRWKGTDQQVLIPPTYDSSANTEMKKQLKNVLIPEGYDLFTTSIPLKIVAVRSGLAEYGRNSLCYIPGKGSFFRLMAFFTDLQCSEYTWRPPVMMERCLNCKTCLVICPLGVIDEDRFLIHAERCLTFHNEHAGDFSKNIDRSFHHCLFGCLRCQIVCPENNKPRKWMEERERFSEYETLVILNGISLDQIPKSTKQKLSKLGLIDDYPLLARNLSVLLN
jgi:epoxyqueuosine reductase